MSAWACLIKSDYNFVFIMFAYFYIVSRKDNLSITIVSLSYNIDLLYCHLAIGHGSHLLSLRDPKLDGHIG